MAHPFWFNRMVEYWSMPLNLDLIDLVRRARIQLVQAGTFGPQFYSLADDPEADRRWVGMPLVGVRENLAHAERMINGVQEAGARFIGQMSMSWHYGDHETNKGLFGVWDTLWTNDLLGPRPVRTRPSLRNGCRTVPSAAGRLKVGLTGPTAVASAIHTGLPSSNR